MGDGRVEVSRGRCANLKTELVSLRALLQRELRIPEYQRPYKWHVRNVGQLIDDIDTFRHSGEYRIGTVILHHDRDGHLNIVDGQQRFLTFCLITSYLASCDEVDSCPDVSGVSVPSLELGVTRANMLDNYAEIRDVLGGGRDLKSWAEFFFDKCQVVLLTVSNLDEAFQMFDSQNTRGRALYPTDLLKAFHIREMSPDQTTPETRLAMVRLWEEIPPESIDELFSDYLFKIKRWANGIGVATGGFGTGDIGLFKGIKESGESGTGNRDNRWAMPFLYAKNYTDDFQNENATLIRYGVLPAASYPFQIDQPVINGETFFQMVRHYYELGLSCGLFRGDPRSTVTHVLSGLDDSLAELNPHVRKPTHRMVRNLFDCLVLYYVDRFGEQDLESASRLMATYAMALRVQHKQVRRVMINNYALGRGTPAGNLPAENLFQVVRLAVHTKDVVRRPKAVPQPNGYPELFGLFDIEPEEAR